MAALQTAVAADLVAFTQFEKRWTDSGFHNKPDPCAGPTALDIANECNPETGANCTDYRVTWGPAAGNSPTCHLDHSCSCIGHGGDDNVDGRLPEQHGLEADSGTAPPAVSRYGDPIWAGLADAVYAGTATGLPGSEPPPPPPPPPTDSPTLQGGGLTGGGF